ncbi:MAG: hypothetical protein KIT09_17375 [Bryobacteraceae bacterium]|nr:hypothetical protein [Bryobacteraceae bacterium]
MASAILAFIAFTGAFTPVDPPNLAYSTYLPGPAAVYSVADKTGALYFTFDSTSACYAGPSYDPRQPVVAAFIGRLEREGQTVTWVACVPGASGGIAIDDAAALYLATKSSGSSTITRLAADTLRPVYATALGAASVTALALDRAGSVYAAGAAGPE